MTLKAVNRHFDFRTGQKNDSDIGFRKCIKEVDYTGDDAFFENWNSGWGTQSFYCLDKTKNAFLYNNYRDLSRTLSNLYISVEKCTGHSWCETDATKIEQFWQDINFLLSSFHD